MEVAILKTTSEMNEKELEELYQEFHSEWLCEWKKANPDSSFRNKNCAILQEFYDWCATWQGFKEGYDQEVKNVQKKQA